ncbi:MAG: FMN-dependent NADH-azoreductase [Sphingobium sp.]
MSNLLVIRSSANGANSVSNKLIDAFLGAARSANPALAVTDRDLDADPVPHVRSSTLAGIGRPAPETEAARPTRELSDRLIGEMQAADLIVIGAPMYNFSIPSTLKSWLDHVLRAGATFQYTAEGPEGLLKGKRVVIIASRAGAYSEGAGAAMDHQISYLRLLLGFIGITNVDVVLAEGLAFGEDAALAAIGAATAELEQKAGAL